MISVNPSAFKHGISEEDILCASAGPIYRVELDEENPWRELRLGFDASSRLLEVVVLTFDSGNELVIHAMKARQKYLELLQREKFS